MSASPAPANDAAASSSSSSLWKEYKNAEGRPYWFHTEDKRSVWEKPDDLKTPREKAIAQTRWKEYKQGEKSYYVHSDTKESTWTVPKELQDAFDRLEGKKPASPAPGPPPGPPPVAPPSKLNPVAGGPPRPIYSGPPPGFGPSQGSASPAAASPGLAPGPPPGPPPIAPGQAPIRPPTQMPVRPPPTGPANLSSPASGPPPPTGPLMLPRSDAPFNPHEAFKSLLREKGVALDWTWEQTMRAVVTEPLYKVLKSIAERKAAFAEYQGELRRQKDEEIAEKKAQVKPPVVALLTGSEKLKSYSTWPTVMKHYGQAKEVKAALEAVGEEAVKAIWEEVRRERVKKDEATARELRHRNMDLMMSLLRTFEADVTTRWRDAHRTVLESSEWKQDASLSSMETADMITVFEEYIRSIEREEGERRKNEDKERVRAERKRRVAFRKLMEEGREQGWIRAGVAWPDVYQRIKDDERYTSMLGQRGSTPLDLFFDVVDACEQRVEARTAAVIELIRKAEPQWKGVPDDAEWDQFLGQVQAGLAATDGSERWASTARDDVELRQVFDQLREESARAKREAKRRHERKVRHLIDDARYGLKKDLDDALMREAEQGASYESVKERIEALGIREWKAIDVELGEEGGEREEVKRTTWEKFCRRQKEKMEERAAAAAATSTSRKRKSDASTSLLGGEDEKRSRRREDRDLRRRGSAEPGRGGGGGEEREKRRSGRDEDTVMEPATSSSSSARAGSPGTKRSRREEASPPVSSSRRAMVSQSAADDGDKEEGEV